jgi:hypothetical protein
MNQLPEPTPPGHERRKAIPFAVTVQDNSDIVPPIEHVGPGWDKLDREDYSHLDKRLRRTRRT